MSQYRSAENGFVSLITAIMVSLLLMVVTLSMVTLEVVQLRKAADSEQAIRAFYTAEAGVEDAVNKVLNGTVTGDQSCTDAGGNLVAGSREPNFDSAGQAGWTCQQISFSGRPTGKLERPDVATTIDPGAAPAFTSVMVEWDQSNNADPNYYNAPVVLPPMSNYTYASPIELTVVRYPSSTVKVTDFCSDNQKPSSSSCKVLMQNALIAPRGTTPGAGTQAYNGEFANGGPFAGRCWQARPEYRCQEVLTGFNPGHNYLFRIRSRYGGSAYRFTFYDGAGNVVSVPDGTATIDVTAKAGQSYRRTITKVPISKGVASGLDYVIFSDTGICKSFTVVNNIFPASTCQ